MDSENPGIIASFQVFYRITLQLAVFAASLLLIACPSPGGVSNTNPSGGGTTTPATAPKTYTTTVSGTVTALPPGESSSINLPGATVSALTTPPNPANKPTAAGLAGRFTLEVKHPGTFRLKVENTCYNSLTTDAFTASADGSRNAGALRLMESKPTGTDRYSITPRTAGGFKLTVKHCVREIWNTEFSGFGAIITDKATAEGKNRFNMITEIELPSTLTKIDTNGLARHSAISETLTIPRNVQTIESGAFAGNAISSVYTVSFAADSKLKSIGSSAFQLNTLKDFRLPENLETIDSTAFIDVSFSFSPEFSPAGTLTIPAKVSKIGERAFRDSSGITAVDIRSDRLAKPDGATPADFPLQPNLFQNVTGITEIKLPQTVYDSYTKIQLQAIFGGTFTNYRKPDGTAYNFAGKS